MGTHPRVFVCGGAFFVSRRDTRTCEAHLGEFGHDFLRCVPDLHSGAARSSGWHGGCDAHRSDEMDRLELSCRLCGEAMVRGMFSKSEYRTNDGADGRRRVRGWRRWKNNSGLNGNDGLELGFGMTRAFLVPHPLERAQQRLSPSGASFVLSRASQMCRQG